MNKWIKHEPTMSPYICEHCAYIWFGKRNYLPYTSFLFCSKCQQELIDRISNSSASHIKAISEGDFQRIIESIIYAYVMPEMKEVDRVPDIRLYHFDDSVPIWMQKAIKQYLIIPDNHDQYCYEIEEHTERHLLVRRIVNGHTTFFNRK